MSIETAEAKDPLENLKYSLDFSSWLNDNAGGGAVASAVWVIPSDLAAANDSETSTTAINQ